MTQIILDNGMALQTDEPAMKVVEIFRQARLTKQMYVEVSRSKDGKKFTYVNPAQVKIITDISNQQQQMDSGVEDDTET